MIAITALNDVEVSANKRGNPRKRYPVNVEARSLRLEANSHLRMAASWARAGRLPEARNALAAWRTAEARAIALEVDHEFVQERAA